MAIFNSVDGTGLVNQLFYTYDWQDKSLKDPSPGTVYPPESSLYSNTVYPSDTMFDQLKSDVEMAFAEARSQNSISSSLTLTYGPTGDNRNLMIEEQPVLSSVVSLLINDEGVLTDSKTHLSVGYEQPSVNVWLAQLGSKEDGSEPGSFTDVLVDDSYSA